MTGWAISRLGPDEIRHLRPAPRPVIRDRSGLTAMEAICGDYHRFDVFVRMHTPA